MEHPSLEGTALPASGRYTCCLCLYPRGQEHVSTQLAGRHPCAQMSTTGSVILGERRVNAGGNSHCPPQRCSIEGLLWNIRTAIVYLLR